MYAQEYIQVNLAALYLMGLTDGTRRFLNGFGLAFIPFQIQIFGNIVHISMCHMLVQ